MSLREKLFQYRSYTPIPFLILMVIVARPTWISMAGGGLLLLAGELLRFWGVAYAGPLTRVTGSVGAPELVVTGPFAYVRNPLYVGNIVMYAGIGIMANALFPWLVLAALAYFVFQYAMIVSLEEEFLARQFGASYEEYRKRVPRFLPAFRSPPAVSGSRQHPDWKGALRSERRTLQAVGLVVLILLVQWGVA